jgi:MFS family permease
VTSALGPGATLSLNSASFLISATLLTTIAGRGPAAHPGTDKARVLHGLRTIWQVPPLRALYLNAVLFGTALMAMGPLLALFVVRDLGLSAWQYGLILGLPCLGGMAAGWVSHRWIARFGRDRLLLGTGLLRVVWLVPMAGIPAGRAALAVMLALQFGLLFTAGLFNPAFASARIELTPEHRLSAVVGTWAATTRLVFPVGIVALGFLAEGLGVRAALLIGSCIGAVSVAPLLLSTLRRSVIWTTTDPRPQTSNAI